MFRWLRVEDGSYHERVLASFRQRIAEVAGWPDADRQAAGAMVSEIFSDLADRSGSVDGFSRLPRERQKELVVRLISHEADSEGEGDTPTAAAAALVSYFLASMAAHDEAAVAEMRDELVRLARLAAPDFEIG